MYRTVIEHFEAVQNFVKVIFGIVLAVDDQIEELVQAQTPDD